MSNYIINYPCSECEQMVPHTVNEHIDYAECVCPLCKAESFQSLGDGEQEAIHDHITQQEIYKSL
jgi:hypothetical protein